MDKSEVKAWVDENIESLMRTFGIPHWRVQVFYERIESDGNFAILMTCQSKPEYERAAITIDADRIPDLDELAITLKHELMHVIHSPYEIPYKVACEMLNEDQIRVLNTAWRHAEEMTVRNLERMHAGHKKEKL